MFNGRTGAALSTVNYEPPRGTVSSWGDSYGNRVDRFLAGTAYLDGQRPSLIMARGYYTRTVVVAWDFRNGTLTRRWTFDTQQLHQRRHRRPGQPPAVHRRRGRRRPGRDHLRLAGHRRQRRQAVEHRPTATATRCTSATSTRRGRPGGVQGRRGRQQAVVLVRRRPYRSDHLVDPGQRATTAAACPATSGPAARRRVLVRRRGRRPRPVRHRGHQPQARLDELPGLVGRRPRSASCSDGTHIDKYGTSGDTRLLTAAACTPTTAPSRPRRSPATCSATGARR